MPRHPADIVHQKGIIDFYLGRPSFVTFYQQKEDQADVALDPGFIVEGLIESHLLLSHLKTGPYVLPTRGAEDDEDKGHLHPHDVESMDSVPDGVVDDGAGRIDVIVRAVDEILDRHGERHGMDGDIGSQC